MKLIHYTTLLALMIVTFSSCEKVIHVDLNAVNPQYVIEGNITDGPGPYRLTITKTVNFEKDNVFPGVDSALVIVTDNTGIVDTLTNTGNGYYWTNKTVGAVGKTYTLQVKVADREFTASSTMPAPVPIDSMYSDNAIAFGDNLIFMVPIIHDPANIANYYNFRIYINNNATKGVYCTDDTYFAGQKISLTLFPDGGPNTDNDRIKVGDSVRVVMESIDKPVYNYFFSLGETIGQDAASPSNPTSNISGGCLGYFSACALTSKTMLITH
ncbi:MAG: DUF4249 domain-containing protein [Chitinophagia bacterium]|nr:DUF4249 domain-containing protein [Chitinophagia bacterium]